MLIHEIKYMYIKITKQEACCSAGLRVVFEFYWCIDDLAENRSYINWTRPDAMKLYDPSYGLSPACSATAHYPSQCWLIGNWTIENQLQWKVIQDTNILFQRSVSENIICKIWAKGHMNIDFENGSTFDGLKMAYITRIIHVGQTKNDAVNPFRPSDAYIRQ